MSHPVAIWLKSHVFGITITLLFAIIIAMVFFEGNDAPPTLYASQETALKVTDGKVLLTRTTARILKAWDRETLRVGDIVKTLPRSRATIFWADGSVTRMAEKTSITITSLQVSNDLSSVQIRFETTQGKTWSNVIRSLLPDSFFEQTYDNGTYVATVRGTVFEVNLDRDYARAVHHGISIKNTKTWSETEVLQGKIVGARNWKELGKQVLDAAWEKWNNDEDVIYVDGQLKKLSDNLFAYTQKNQGVSAWMKKIRKLVRKEESVDSLVSQSILEKNSDKLDALKASVALADTPEKKALLHTKLLAYHQATNLLPENASTLALRDTLRDLIIETAADDGQKTKLEQTFAQVTFNDYVDAVKGGANVEAGKLKGKLENALREKIASPAIEDYSRKTREILWTEKVQKAIDDVKTEGGNLIDSAKNAIINSETEKAVDGLKEDAAGLFDDLKNAARQ